MDGLKYNSDEIFNEIDSLSTDSEKLAVLIPYVKDLIRKQNMIVSTVKLALENQEKAYSEFVQACEVTASAINNLSEAANVHTDNMLKSSENHLYSSEQIGNIWEALNKHINKIIALEDRVYGN